MKSILKLTGLLALAAITGFLFTVGPVQSQVFDKVIRDNYWFQDQKGLWLGNLPDSKFYYNIIQTPDTVTLGVSPQSNQFVIMEFADLDTDAANALAPYPSITIMSADLSNYTQVGNDGTNGAITVGSGSLSLPALIMAGDLEMADNNINMGTALLDAGDFTMIDGAQTGDDEVVFAMSGDGSGDFTITTDDGHISLLANDDIYLTPTGNDVIVTGRAEITSGAAEAFRLLTNATDYTGFTMDADGGLAITSVDAAAAAANISITADGTYAVTSTGYNLSGAGAVSGVTTIEATGRVHTLVGAAEALRLSANADDYVGFTMDANGALAMTTVDTAAAAANIAITADGTYAVTSTGYNLTGAGAVSGVTDLSMTGELDLTGVAALIDLNPAATGTQEIINITPTATLAAASDWVGIDITADALDPLTGAATNIMGLNFDFSGVLSADGDDAQVYGTYMELPTGDTATAYGHTQVFTEMTVAGRHVGFASLGNAEVLSATAQYDGLWVDWNGVTRDAGAPIMHGITVEMMADYTAFGASYAGYFSGEGRSVTLADTTYAMDANGDSRFQFGSGEFLLLEGDTTRLTTQEVLDIDATIDTTTATDDVPVVTSTVGRAAADTGGTYNYDSTLTTGNMANSERSYVYGGNIDSSAAVTATSTASVFFAGTPSVGVSSNDYGLEVVAGYDQGIFTASPLGVIQASDVVAASIDSEATSITSYSLTVTGVVPLNLEQDITSGRGMIVSRDIAEAGSLPLVTMLNDNSADTQATLNLGNDGSGPHITTNTATENLEINPATTGHTVMMASNGSATQDVASFRNDDLGATGETGQTSDIVFQQMTSADSGSTWTPAEASRISNYRIADFWTAGGAADDDAGLKFYTQEGGASNLALTLNEVMLASFTGAITSSINDLNWAMVASGNQACTTTCTSACVFGWDDGVPTLTGCSDGTSDKCICAGGS